MVRSAGARHRNKMALQKRKVYAPTRGKPQHDNPVEGDEDGTAASASAASAAAAAPPTKQELGDALYSAVLRLGKDDALAAKIVGMLLNGLADAAVQAMIDSEETLREGIAMAMDALEGASTEDAPAIAAAAAAVAEEEVPALFAQAVPAGGVEGSASLSALAAIVDEADDEATAAKAAAAGDAAVAAKRGREAEGEGGVRGKKRRKKKGKAKLGEAQISMALL